MGGRKGRKRRKRRGKVKDKEVMYDCKHET